VLLVGTAPFHWVSVETCLGTEEGPKLRRVLLGQIGGLPRADPFPGCHELRSSSRRDVPTPVIPPRLTGSRLAVPARRGERGCRRPPRQGPPAPARATPHR